MRSLIAVAMLAGTALGAGGPENAVVLVNGDSWASLAIANEYAALRDIAPEHFIVLRDLPSFERMRVEDFRERILGPALQTADRRGLAPQLDYLLYSADFPTAIDVSADIAGKKLPQQITQPAALTGLTFLYQYTVAKSPAYLGLNVNFYFRQLAKGGATTPLPPGEQARYGEALKKFQEIAARLERARGASSASVAIVALEAEDARGLRDARDTFRSVSESNPAHTEVLYNLACAQARLGELEPAVGTLRLALDRGWWDMQHARMDPDLRALHARGDFKELSAQAATAKFELAPTSGFRGSVGWLPSGQPVPAGQGARFLLSTMLGYTSGRGNSVPEALAALRRSAQADGSRPAGTIYFLENGDVRSETRAWGFRRAVEKLSGMGVKAQIEAGTLPKGKNDVAGLVAGVSDFAWAQSGSTILPGAICEHLTSCGGMLHEGDTQTALTEFIRHGAAGASGTVHEPYAIQAKFPTPFLQYHYAQGCTLAEAFYQSVAGPYQLLIVGDALAAPWKKRIVVSAPELTAGMTLRGPLRFTPSVSSSEGITISQFELHLNGHRVALAKAGEALEFDTTRAPDGVHQLQVVAHGSDPIATTGRLVVPCMIRNLPGEITASCDAGEAAPWDREITFTVEAEGAKAIVFRQLGREVARIDAARGSVKIDPRLLGPGPVRVQPIALLDGGRERAGKPFEFRVVPPAALPAMNAPSGVKLVPGLHVSAAGGAPVVAGKAESAWLEKAGVKADAEFAVEGWFSLDADEVCQFQLRGPSTLRVFVDGQAQTWPRGKEWWYLPVSLAKGLHRVRIEGKADGAPQLDARFGGPGAYRMSEARFQHPE